MVQGILMFNEQEGHYCIIDDTKEEVLADINFGDRFQVQIDGNWVDTQLEIGTGAKGDMVFLLKGTKIGEGIQGQTVRM